jgi:hypothetical protein
VPPNPPAETPHNPAGLWMYFLKLLSRTCLRMPG